MSLALLQYQNHPLNPPPLPQISTPAVQNNPVVIRLDTLIRQGNKWSDPQSVADSDSLIYRCDRNSMVPLEISFDVSETDRTNTENSTAVGGRFDTYDGKGWPLWPGQIVKPGGIFRSFRVRPLAGWGHFFESSPTWYNNESGTTVAAGTACDQPNTPGSILLRAGMNLVQSRQDLIASSDTAPALVSSSAVGSELAKSEQTVANGGTASVNVVSVRDLFTVFRLSQFRRAVLEIQCRPTVAFGVVGTDQRIPYLKINGLDWQRINLPSFGGLQTFERIYFGTNFRYKTDADADAAYGAVRFRLNLGNPRDLARMLSTGGITLNADGTGSWDLTARWVLDQGDPDFLQVDYAEGFVKMATYGAGGYVAGANDHIVFVLPVSPKRGRFFFAADGGLGGSTVNIGLPERLNNTPNAKLAQVGVLPNQAPQRLDCGSVAGHPSGYVEVQVVNAGIINAMRVQTGA